MNVLNLIYIGEQFYSESKTYMSSIYTLDGERSDWGFVQCALRDGCVVNIRPATKIELHYYKAKLNELRRGWEKRGKQG